MSTLPPNRYVVIPPARRASFRAALDVIAKRVARIHSERGDAPRRCVELFECAFRDEEGTFALSSAYLAARRLKDDLITASETLYAVACALEALAVYGETRDAARAATALAHVAEFAGYMGASDAECDVLEACADAARAALTAAERTNA